MPSPSFPWLTQIGQYLTHLTNFYGAPWKNTTLLFGDKLPTMQYHSLLMVESAFRGDTNPADLFLAYSRENRGQYRRTLRIFASRLTKGLSIIDALEQTPDVLQANSVVALRHGILTGTLPQTFEMLKAEAIDRRHSANHDASKIRFYWLIIGVVLLLLLVLISNKILPTFDKMMAEYELEPSASSALLQTIFNTLLLALPWLILAIILLSLTGLLSAFRAWVRRTLLPMVTLTKDLISTATILRLLSVQLQEKGSLTTSLSILAKYHNRRAVRMKLLLARNEHEHGLNIWHCLNAAKLITTAESHTLQQQTKAASQIWILSKLAEQRDYRANLIADRFVVILTPALALIWGGIVLCASLVVFRALLTMVVSIA